MSGKNIIKFHAMAMVALINRLNLQHGTPPTWQFQFPANGALVLLSDRVVDKNVKLHAGLNMTVIIEGSHHQDVVNIATSLSNRLMDIISFTTLTHCDVPRLLSHISINDDGTSTGTFFEQPDDDASIIIGTPRTVDQKVFDLVWKAFNSSQYQERIFRAIEWFRKSIREKYVVDQFISFFVSIEVIKPILRDILKTNIKNPREWDGIIQTFTNKINSFDFKDINKARNELLHGHKPLTPEFTAIIRSYIDPLRKSIIYGIGTILNLTDATMDTIVSNNPRRLLSSSSVGLTGTFNNLPTKIDELLKNYPEMLTTRKPNRYSIRDTGELDITFSVDQLARLPSKTIFNANSMVFIAEADASIVSVASQIYDK